MQGRSGTTFDIWKAASHFKVDISITNMLLRISCNNQSALLFHLSSINIIFNGTEQRLQTGMA